MHVENGLKEAIYANDTSFLLSFLKKNSIDTRFSDESNDTLLLFACSIPSSESYDFFVNNNADILAINEEGEGVIHSIVYSGDLIRLENFIKLGVDVNLQAKDGATPLLLALSLEKEELAQYLIKNGADVNLSDLNGIQPIHLAVQYSDVSMVKSLIRKGANVSSRTNMGNVPIALAANKNQYEIVSVLLKEVNSPPSWPGKLRKEGL